MVNKKLILIPAGMALVGVGILAGFIISTSNPIASGQSVELHTDTPTQPVDQIVTPPSPVDDSSSKQPNVHVDVITNTPRPVPSASSATPSQSPCK